MSETWTTSEVAKVLGVKPDTVCQWVHRGKIRPVAAGVKPLRFHLDEIRKVFRPVTLSPAEHAEVSALWDALAS